MVKLHQRKYSLKYKALLLLIVYVQETYKRLQCLLFNKDELFFFCNILPKNDVKPR